MIGIVRKAMIAMLLLVASNAWALGLGQIKVKSRLHQPLVAEIPIISTTPGELAALNARMASPETFRRIGLSPPTGAAANLQFSLGSDGRGNPIIRVTSVQPIDQPVVNFLIEVDWGTGKLVREYSALVAEPNTAGAPAPATVQMPAAAASNLVQRDAAPVEPAVAPDAIAPQPAPAPTPEPTAAAPAPLPAVETNEDAVALDQPPPAPPEATAPDALPPETPPAELAPASPEPEAAVTDASQYGPVRPGETLSAIASDLGLRSSFSLNQTMLALLRSNPDAFINDNINLLRSGAVLRIPDAADVAQISASDAADVVRQQIHAWRQARRAVLQPAQAPGQSTAASSDAGTPARAAGKPAASGRVASAASAAAGRSDARLEILPPAGPGRATGMRTGTGSGNEGTMLQQELNQRDEEIASRTAEVGELKERVAALERIRDEQARLLSMKDSELAAAQHRLAQANQATAQASAPPAQAPDAAQGGKEMYFIGGGIGVLVIGLVVWFFTRRRKPEPASRRPAFDHDALAASMGEIDRKRAESRRAAETPAAEPPAEPAAAGTAAPAAAGARQEAPAWHSGWVVKDSVTRTGGPVTASTPAETDASAEPDSEPPAHATAEQRFKLVDAFLDMGDRHSAEQLLAELLNDEDDAVSEKAGKMLARLMG